jgi:hypothetical protein
MNSFNLLLTKRRPIRVGQKINMCVWPHEMFDPGRGGGCYCVSKKICGSYCDGSHSLEVIIKNIWRKVKAAFILDSFVSNTETRKVSLVACKGFWQ